MSARTLQLSDSVHRYFLEVAVAESAPLRELRAETSKLPGAGMQISPEQGRFMGWLVELLGARRALEVGVFTGYSSLCVAQALPADGQLVACDISEEWTELARRYWRRAGVDGKVTLRLGPAASTLEELLAAGEAGSYDFAFIDADKQNYALYYDRCLELLRQGGVLAVDNTLWGGSVADPERQDDSTRAIRALNQKAFADRRVSACLVPIGDGLLLARKS
jgi:predicted O-methyltransferase YrrM